MTSPFAETENPLCGRFKYCWGAGDRHGPAATTTSNQEGNIFLCDIVIYVNIS
jgi:hypothetical protein